MKNIFFKFSFLFILLASSDSFSQPLSKGEFRQLFTQGNLMILEKFYDTASKVFLKLNTSDPSNANVNYKIGVCYLNMPGQKAKSIPYFENALKQTSGNYQEDEPTEKNAPEIVLYNLGQAYHYAYRFDEAMAQFAKYRDIIGKWNLNLVKEVVHWSETSKSAKEITAKKVDCTISNLGDSVNCEFADYSPVIAADESFIAFTSRRIGTGGKENKTINDEYMEDIWLCNRGPYGTWTRAKSISRTINSDGNEATIGLSADGQDLYVYRDDNGDGNIYKSALDGEFWNAPSKIDAGTINSKKWEPSACVSADGNTMYFVSDRTGGQGGRDIYLSRRMPDKSWGVPENLGTTINTPYDEDAPFMHPDGTTFFFSSSGHNSIGGFDVFYCTRVANNVWTDPINMGYPINTTDDDIYFVTSSDGRRAYYASFRPGGKGEKDIYMVSMPKAFVKSVAILVGYLKNKDGSPIPRNSLITAKSAKGDVISNRINEATGKFVQPLFPGQDYEISISTDGNIVFNDQFFLPEDSSYQNLGRGFFQRVILIGDTTNLFSMKRPSDTTWKQKEVTPMEGKILLSQDPNDAAKGLTVQLLNAQGNIIASAVTDEKGNFNFQNVPADQKYLLKVDENDPLAKTHNQFYLADNNGKIIQPSTQEGKFFLFKNISPELSKLGALDTKDVPLSASVMTGRLAIDAKNKTGLGKAIVSLLDEKGNVLQKKITDENGNFSFDNLPSDNKYTLSLKDNDPSLFNNHPVYLLNKKEMLIRKVIKLGDYFVFENLPADLNQLSTLDMSDDTHLVAMKGKLLTSSKVTDPTQNLSFELVNSKGKMIQRTTTDTTGAFQFDNLSSDYNYTIQLNEGDPILVPLSKVYLANESDKIVKIIDLHKKEKSFKNVPADLMQLAEMKDTYVTLPVKDSVNVITHKNAMYPGDEKFDFVVYFPYNKKEINISVGSFVELMDKVAKTISENGSATIIIAASSSSVPTRSFPSNEALAESRANEVKDKVRASMSLKNLDESKLHYEINAKVLGPAYKNDAMQNRKEYEKWQFVKVIVK